ncbi:MAG: DNA polymerase III subunit beta [Actinomycetes bacterium]|nr:DNA polymerase III subunit beta [Actinomycetes bacterium]MDX5380887.1 DNA polymerase III subunit beta [Actinomycetes bacterium]MDX5399971.1 DNA polymerase III subunit beta [Actinomycetes bacterium]MDX5450638.1 DNA polymerase III subunit beta [Actinomycetes bacterium]
MKFRVDRDVLAEAVAWAARSLPTRPAVPVLSGVLLEADDSGTLTISSFDYEVSARCEVPATVSVAGIAVVQGKILADIAKALPSRPVDLELDGTKLVLTCGASRFALHTMPVDDYPNLPELPELSGSIDAGAFNEAVLQVTTAASRDETLPLLTGVRVEVEGERITLLATDRYRLAMKEIQWAPRQPGTSQVALVRARTLSDVAKSMTQAGTVQLALQTEGGKQIIGFESAGRRTTSQLIEGDYPPVRRLFPDVTPIFAVARTAEIIEAARRVALVAERNTPIRLTFSEGQVVMEAGQGDDAQASEALEATLVGEDITTAFNPHLFLDGLSALGTEYVRLGFTHPSKPVLMSGRKGADDEDEGGFLYLLMPIRFAS